MSSDIDDTVCWGDLLRQECEIRKDDYSKIVTTLTPHELTRRFDNGYGGTEGAPFTAWTDRYVYFPWCYDGAEGVASVPRNPCDEATEHVGGG